MPLSQAKAHGMPKPDRFEQLNFQREKTKRRDLMIEGNKCENLTVWHNLSYEASRRDLSTISILVFPRIIGPQVHVHLYQSGVCFLAVPYIDLDALTRR